MKVSLMNNLLKQLTKTAFTAIALVLSAYTAHADYGWAENAGWINTTPTGSGMQITSNGANGYLSGYVWGENVGWIKLGDGTGPYLNNSASDWGVNMNASGDLSGYAWGENIGWIKFNSGASTVHVDIASSSLAGYAWAENIGWINFTGPSPILVTSGASWKYYSTGSLPATNWFVKTYTDSGWSNGVAPLGYADPAIVTLLDFGGNATNVWPTYYFRTSFSVPNTAVVTGLLASLIADDGAILYLNGTKIHTTTNMPIPSDNSTFTGSTFPEPYVAIDFTINPSMLVTGTNVLAVELHQATNNSSDAYFDLSLTKVAYATTNQLGGGVASTNQPPSLTDTSSGWTAYNDLSWDSSQISSKISRLTWVDDADHDLTGKLVRYADGVTSPVTITFAGASGAGLWVTTNQGSPNAGTPGYLLFDGKVDMDRTVFVPSTNAGTMTLSGMDPNRHYKIVLLGNRGDPTYTVRDTVVTLSGADSFTNASSAGAVISGASSQTTTIITGTNTGGLIFNYTGIAPGSDGQISLNVVGGAGNPFSWYLNTMLVELLPTNGAAYADSDTDGMDDTWETTYFGSTTATNGGMLQDSDGDGSCNYDEYRAGTDPTAPGSTFEMTSATSTNTPGFAVFTWSSVAGKTYSIQYGTNIALPMGLLQSGIQATPPVNVYTSPVSTTRAFIRIKVD